MCKREVLYSTADKLKCELSPSQKLWRRYLDQSDRKGNTCWCVDPPENHLEYVYGYDRSNLQYLLMLDNQPIHGKKNAILYQKNVPTKFFGEWGGRFLPRPLWYSFRPLKQLTRLVNQVPGLEIAVILRSWLKYFLTPAMVRLNLGPSPSSFMRRVKDLALAISKHS